MSKKTRKVKIDRRELLTPQDYLEFVADEHVGGSGVGVFISGRIQSMAREILTYRANHPEEYLAARKRIEALYGQFE